MMNTLAPVRRLLPRTPLLPLTIRALVGFSLALGVPVFAALKITVTDLHPAGASLSQAWGVSATQQVGVVVMSETGGAALWSGTADSFVNLSPVGWFRSEVWGASEAQQVGAVIPAGGATTHAALWSSSADSFVDLNPVGSTLSSALGTSGLQQVGYFETPMARHAALWSGAADSVVDLQPSGLSFSVARGLSGSQQVGYVHTGHLHAALWWGTADSFVDLHPVGASDSVASGVHGSMQVGSATIDGKSRAALWFGTAGSFVDLNPVGASVSAASGVHSSVQVGSATIDGRSRAALWFGTADSFVDLGASLGAAFSHSSASGIWSDDSTTRIVGMAWSSEASVDGHAILWTIQEVPDPPPLKVASWQWAGGANVVTLTWANIGSGCVLEGTGSLSGGWNTVSAPLTTNANCILATVTSTASAQFFRLRRN